MRTLFDLGDCEAEFSQLQIGEERLQTVALEARSQAAEALLRETGLDEKQNESYASSCSAPVSPGALDAVLETGRPCLCRLVGARELPAQLAVGIGRGADEDKPSASR